MPNSVHSDQGEGESAGAERHSIFGEILDWMLAPLLVLWPLSIAITWLVAKSIANQPFDHALEQALQNLSQQLRLEQGQYRIPSATLRAQSLADELDLRYLQFSDATQHILDGDIELPIPNEEQAKPGIQFRNSNLYGQELRIAYMWLAIPSSSANPNAAAPHFALLQVAETLHKRAKFANEIIRGVILPQFVILPLALFLVWFALARGLSPISVLQQRIRARQPDDVSPIVSLNLPQEISPLLQSLNEMLARLAHAIAQQKRFIADAAHQMKTPLAGMRMQAELALRDAGQSNLTEVQRSLLQLAKSSENATHLVNQLLSLARAENQPATDSWQRVDLLALAQQTLQDWVALAISKEIDLGFDVRARDAQICATPSAAWLYGQPFLLRELMNNLIDNALRYNTPGCVVTLRLTVSAEMIELEVEDNGPGIAPIERDRVFERFYRILGNQASGSGLGLAIVREIAQQHNASISISEHPACHDLANRGCVFHICFPAQPVPDSTSAPSTGN